VALRIELFGIARARAGVESVLVEAGRLDAALLALSAACPGLEPEVLAEGRLRDGFLVSLNGERFITDPSTRVEPGDSLVILGAQGGG